MLQSSRLFREEDVAFVRRLRRTESLMGGALLVPDSVDISRTVSELPDLVAKRFRESFTSAYPAEVAPTGP
jgi:hypothetical protein